MIAMLRGSRYVRMYDDGGGTEQEIAGNVRIECVGKSLAA